MLADKIDKFRNTSVDCRISVETTPVAPGNDSDDFTVQYQRTTGVSLAGINSKGTGTKMEWPDWSKVLICYTAHRVLHDGYIHLLQDVRTRSLVLKLSR